MTTEPEGVGSPRALNFVARPLVYVAGPYTTPDPVENSHRTILEATRLADGGLVTPVVPHLTLMWHLVVPRTLEFWYAYDIAIAARCDALLRLSGPSTGADREVEFAVASGIPVFHETSALERWAEEWIRITREGESRT